MQRAMVPCNGVQTQVLTEGRWVEEGLSPDGSKHLVILIPGNPGIPDFYEDFVKTLKANLPPETPVWVVGHAGHVQPPQNLEVTMPTDSAWSEHYSLQAQLEHKKEFIKTYVPEDAKLHIIGHSIGSWFVLNLLKDESISTKVEKCYMLFPTIEHMAKTPNGQFFTRIVTRISSLLVLFSWLLTSLPLAIQVFLIRLFGIIYGIPAKSTKAVLQLLNPRALDRVLKLGKEEMELVNERDDDVLFKYQNKLWFYYGNCDGWTPIKYYKDLISQHPNIEAILCEQGYHHSFVLQHDRQMGEIVADLIKEKIS